MLKASPLFWLSVTALWRRGYRRISTSEIVHKVAATYATQIVLIAINAATLILVTRALGPTGRGDYTFAMWLTALGIQFGNLGLHSSNTLQVAKSPQLLPTLFINSLLVSLAVGGLGTLLFGVVLSTWPQIGVSGGLLRLAIGAIPFGLALLLLQNLALGAGAIGVYNGVDLLNNGLKIGFILVIVALGWATPTSICAACLVAVLVAGSCAYVVLYRRCPTPPRPSWLVLRDSVRLGSKVYASALIGWLATKIDVALVQNMLGAKALGLYGVAQLLVQQAILFPQVVVQIVFPRLCQCTDLDQKLRLTLKTTLLMAAIMLPAAVLAGICGRPLITLCFGKDFAGAVDAFYWLLPGVVVLSIEMVFRQMLQSDGFRTSIVFAWLATLMVNLGLNLWLIPLFNISGAGIAWSLSLVFLSVVTLILVLKEIQAHHGANRHSAT